MSEDIKKEEIKAKSNPNPNAGSAINKNEDDFKEVILEDIETNNVKNSQEKKEVESQSFSTSMVNSQGVDSSAGPSGMNNFDYVEDAEKKV